MKQILLALLLQLSLVSPAWADEPFAPAVSYGQQRTLPSQILGEERRLSIALPRSYSAGGGTRYPVLYLLDAEFNHFFATFSAMAAQMATDATPSVPEMIVVGIHSQRRVRDSTPTDSRKDLRGIDNASFAGSGGADRFLDFVREELIPFIGREYRTDDYRLLFGYSLTGLPVLQSLMSQPDLFNAYVLADPSLWWDERLMQRRLLAGEYRRPSKPLRFFIATTQELPSGLPPEHFNRDFIAAFERQPIPGVSLGSKIYGAHEDHGSLSVPSFYDGLRFVFADYKLPAWTKVPSATELEAHFARASERLGGTMRPREDLLNWLGYEKLRSHAIEPPSVPAAIALLELNTRYYPQSPNTWDSLGEALEAAGDTPRAEAAYRRALELAPDYPSARAGLQRLQAAAPRANRSN